MLLPTKNLTIEPAPIELAFGNVTDKVEGNRHSTDWAGAEQIGKRFTFMMVKKAVCCN